MSDAARGITPLILAVAATALVVMLVVGARWILSGDLAPRTCAERGGTEELREGRAVAGGVVLTEHLVCVIPT